MASNNKIDNLMKNEEIEFTQFEYVDQSGTVRGKLGPGDDLAKTAMMSNLVLCTRSNEEVVMTPFAGLNDGFYKFPLVSDPETAFQMSWRPHTAAVISNMYNEDGSANDYCPRQILNKAIAKCAEFGFEPIVGFEHEFNIFEDDDEAIQEGRIKELAPVGRGRNAYSHTRQMYVNPIAEEMFRRMKSAGAPLETFHTEYSRGMYEYTFKPLPALAAADGLARSRLYLKELLAENGLTTTVMTALHLFEDSTFSGTHANVSLWKDGKNLFWDEDGKTLSKLGRQFGAGLLATMQDFHLIFRPWVNSFRRYDPDAFCPAHIAWAKDNHLISLRMAHGASPEKNTRWEHRVAGTDTCPHLVLAAVLQGGMYGIENELEIEAETKLEQLEAAPMLANTLQDTTNNFRNSEIARSIFGADVVDHICQIRDEEWDDYENWCKENGVEIDHNSASVTDWEYRRYFDWL